MRDYGVARAVFGFIEFLAWCGVAGGVIIAVASTGAATRGFGSPGLLAAIPGMVMTSMALLTIAVDLLP